MVNKNSVARVVAEALGVFGLALAVLSINRYGIPFFTAIVAGVTYGGMVAVFGGLTGGHFNPAVTVGALMLKRVQLLMAVAYVLAQGVGAVGAWKLYEWFTDKPLVNSAADAFDWKIFVAEMVGAVIFSACVAHAFSRRNNAGVHAGVVVGTGLFVGATVASLASSGILNPAVALGAKSFSLEYALAPIVGAIVGMSLYDMLLDETVSSRRRAVAPAVAVSATKAKASAKKAPARKTASRSKKK